MASSNCQVNTQNLFPILEFNGYHRTKLLTPLFEVQQELSLKRVLDRKLKTVNFIEWHPPNAN
jgi:hypothetical protein